MAKGKKKLNKAEKEYLKQLGKHIQLLRKKFNLTQDTLADELETEHSQIGRLERGQTNVSVIILNRIASVLGISLSELVDINGD